MSLRDATADDAEQVARIYVDSWNAGFAGHLPPRELSQREVARWRDDLADAPVRWRVAVDSGEVVGLPAPDRVVIRSIRGSASSTRSPSPPTVGDGVSAGR